METRTHSQYLAESDRLVDAAQWDDERTLMEAAVDEFPDNPEFCLRYAVALSGSSPDQSSAYALRAAELAPSDPAVLTRCALLLFELELFEGTAKLARRALPLRCRLPARCRVVLCGRGLGAREE